MIFPYFDLPSWWLSEEALGACPWVAVVSLWLLLLCRECRHRLLAKAAQEQNRQLQQAVTAKDEILACISHEIRNALNGVIGMTDSIQHSDFNPATRRKFELLRLCSSHLASLLDDVLDLATIRAGAGRLEIRPFEFPALVESVVAMARAANPGPPGPVEIAISPSVPQHLLGDPRRLRQILLNLIGNALKFTPRGKVTITVWCRPQSAEGRSEVTVAVADNGPGIALTEQGRLFTRFERAAAGRSGRVPGTGLGLALCQELAAKMNGRIWLESVPGEGSCFYFCAPYDHAPVTRPPRGKIRPSQGPTASPRALVLDDQEYNRVALADQLESLGIEARPAASGTEALALAARENFDLVFLDHDLPDAIGPQVARAIRALPNPSARALLVAISAHPAGKIRQDCRAAGVGVILEKPIARHSLLRALSGGQDRTVLATCPPATEMGLANLRLLAASKEVGLEIEIALCLSELAQELAQLDRALADSSPATVARFTHLLGGRGSFLGEFAVAELMRGISAAAARGDWPRARHLRAESELTFRRLRRRLKAAGPVARPG